MPNSFTSPIVLFWFRRDLRLEDNAGLYQALRSGLPVVPVFIFDRKILDALEDKDDRRVSFIFDVVQDLRFTLNQRGVALDIRYGDPVEIFGQLIKAYPVAAVFTNRDYEPYATQRDTAVETMLKEKGISFHTAKDTVIFEKNEVVKDDGMPYRVFTPYSKRWLSTLEEDHLSLYNTQKHWNNFYRQPQPPHASLSKMGFTYNDDLPKEPLVEKDLIRNYHLTRDTPSLRGTSRLGVHLRFGTISIRRLASTAMQLNKTFLGELIWREFFMQILWQEPRVVNESFKPEYENIKWRNNEKEFDAWCNGRTGYPIVDAGMRELNATGFMHNRVRMITASFLVKHLLIDWRWGEAYFARRLLDFELSSNNGNWQWVAGCGCDAAPYFRIFNPSAQTKRFDPQFKYISKWVLEWEDLSYAKPIVDHEAARERCLRVYKQALAASRRS